MTKNMAASVRQRLLNLSRETGERFQNLLTRYGIEMKDFYDIYVLARDFEFDGTVLQASIRRTFEKRETRFREDVPVAWTDEFSEDDAKKKQWRAFLRKSQLDSLPLAEVVAKVRTFLEPAWVAIQAESEFAGTWHDGKWD